MYMVRARQRASTGLPANFASERSLQGAPPAVFPHKQENKNQASRPKKRKRKEKTSERET
jgi:hypothetical protein